MRALCGALVLLALNSASSAAEWTEPDGAKIKATKAGQLAVSRDGQWRASAYGFEFEQSRTVGGGRGSSTAVDLVRARKPRSAKRVWDSLAKNAPYAVLGDPRKVQFTARNDFFVMSLRDGAGHQPYALALVAIRLKDGRLKIVSTDRISKEFVVTDDGRVLFDVFDQWPDHGSAKKIATKDVDLVELFKSPK